MSVQAMFYVKEINHRTTNSADAVDVEVKLAAAFGGYLQGPAGRQWRLVEVDALR